MEQNFYICKHCGKIINILGDNNIPTICCGENMLKLVAGTTDASVEKHVPVYEVKNNKVFVSVGSVEHPMTPEHYIEWICLQTKNGSQINYLKPLEKPQTCFAICEDDEVEAVYAYCNLHSLWKA